MDGAPSRTVCISCGRPLETAGGVDAIEVILKAMLAALTQRLGVEFAAEIKAVIVQESETLAQSPHPDDQYDAKLVCMVAQGKLFRDLGV